MADGEFKDHFSDGSDRYAAYRPRYPVELVNALAEATPTRYRALDCACGNGQLSVLLAEQFQEVLATDASATQIQHAQPHERVTYRVALAEESGLPDSSVDLITVAQAAHWLDLEKFYREVRRVGRPESVIALITYGIFHVEGPVNDLVQHFYSQVLGPYWPAERRHVEEGYCNLTFPFPEIQIPKLAIEVDWRLNDLVGYVSTWSAVKEAEKSLGQNQIADFRDELTREWKDPDETIRVTWPLTVKAGRIA